MTAIKLDSVCQVLSQLAPLSLAESWDNVGLLVGDRGAEVSNVMTCLTVTPAVAEEAIQREANLLVAHHPLPFRPLSRLTCDSIAGTLLWKLIGSGVAIYSAHTAFDSAREGINQAWSESLGLESTSPLIDPGEGQELGSGRYGDLKEQRSAREIIATCGRHVSAATPVRGVGDLDRQVRRIGFACGSGGSFVGKARHRGCDLLITGEATFHDCLEAESSGLVLGLLGHYHSERFAMDRLAERLGSELSGLTVWASEQEADPIRFV